DDAVETTAAEGFEATYDLANSIGVKVPDPDIPIDIPEGVIEDAVLMKDYADKAQALIHTFDPPAEDVIQATNHLVFVEGQLFQAQTLVGELKADIAHFNAVKNAAAECVKHVTS